MANRSYDDRTPDGTSDPLKLEDLIGVSNEDGGGGFDLSKKITIEEVRAFLAIAFGLDGTTFTVPRFSNGVLVDSPITVGESGVTVFSDSLGVGITADNNVGILVNTGGIAGVTHAVRYKNGATVLFEIDNSGNVSLVNGTSINEFSIDGTLAGNSDNAAPTEKAVKTYVDGLITPQIIGGVTLSSSSNTNILNGTYVILADTTTATSVTSGIGQDSNWTLEITQAGITNQKGVITFTGNLEKDGGGGANYDVAIFKNGSIVSESEQIDQKLESDGKGQSVTAMAIIEFSTSDTFDIRVAGNGTANDIFCGGGSLYIQ